jgi:hypothetical protein
MISDESRFSGGNGYHCMFISLTSLPYPLLQPHFVPLPYLKISDTMAWQKIAEYKNAHIAASIPEEWRIKSLPTDDSVMLYPSQSGIMSSEELAITESSAVDLVAELARQAYFSCCYNGILQERCNGPSTGTYSHPPIDQISPI